MRRRARRLTREERQTFEEARLVTGAEPVREILVATGLDPAAPARAPPRQGVSAWDEPA